MPIQLLFSNTMEALALHFAELISRVDDLFAPPAVIIPNPYLKKWLQLETARQSGISMGLNFRSLGDGLWELLDSVNPESARPSMMGQTELFLMVRHALMRGDRKDPRLLPIMDYCGTDGTGTPDSETKIMQLASRLARSYLEYELHRQDMTRLWRRGSLLYGIPMERAQQSLFSDIFNEGGLRDRAAPHLLTLPEYMERMSPRLPDLAGRTLVLFGKSHLSPFHMYLIYELAKPMHIFMFQFNPCSEFWEDATTPSEDRWQRIRSIEVTLRIGRGREEEFLPDRPDENTLLKQWGKQGRETIKLLSQLEDAGSTEPGFISEWIDAGFPDSGGTCLSTVQGQILRRTSAPGAEGALKQDTSIQIASSPDIYREAEAVYNSIIYNLEYNATLNMTDIAVMVSDMELYGPVLHSVFSREPHRLQFSMIDSRAIVESQFGRGFTSLLDIAAGSCTRREVFSLVFNRCFLEAQSLSHADAGVWLAWADRLNIFHGKHDRGDPGPARNHHTWRQGLQRMRFGRIMDSSMESVHDGTFPDFAGIVPYADMHSNDPDRSNSFNRAIELLQEKTKLLKDVRAPARKWIEIIEDLISHFLSIPPDLAEEAVVLDGLRDALQRLVILDGPEGDSGHVLTLEFIRNYMREHLAGLASSRGSYLSSGINISALVPKRQIPFRIIYLMGMQEGIFPGTADHSSLNLLNVKRRIADPSGPDINRYLFLETLLSARDKLYLTYVSKDLQKDSEYYPNSVTGQLITYLNRHVLAEPFVTVQIPPSGCSDEYRSTESCTLHSDLVATGEGGRVMPVNYSPTDRLLILKRASRDSSCAPEQLDLISNLLRSTIPDFSIPPGEAFRRGEYTVISLAELSFFLINPAEASIRRHLGIYTDEDDDPREEEEEPLFSPYPHPYRFVADTIDFFLRKRSIDETKRYLAEYHRHAMLKSLAPGGAYGALDLERILESVMKRLNPGGGIASFAADRDNAELFDNIVIGNAPVDSEPSLTFPSLVLPASGGGQYRRVELTGRLPLLWRRKDNGEFETIVVTHRGKASVRNVIQPFVFYCAARSGLDQSLQEFIGPSTFTIHVASKDRIESFCYQHGPDESRDYLVRLVDDFLDESSCEILPLSIIEDRRLTNPAAMAPDVEDGVRAGYREALEYLIDEDSERARKAYRPTDFLSIIEPRVPDDAYDTVRIRLGPLFRPFLEAAHRA